MCAICQTNQAASSGAALPAWKQRAEGADDMRVAQVERAAILPARSVSGIATIITAALASASTAAARNGARGPKSASSPPIAGPMMKPMPKAAPISPNTPLRFSGGVTSASTELAGL